MAGPAEGPGWYDDPYAPASNAERYWDGSTWTPRRRPKKRGKAIPTPPQYSAPPAPPQHAAPHYDPPTLPGYSASPYRPGPSYPRAGWNSWATGTKAGVIGGLVVVGLLLALALSGALTPGPSASYLWGQRAGNSAVSLVHSGLAPDTACETSIEAGMMFSDNPVLNPTPPPDNFDMSDIRKGCLDQLHKRLGY